MKVFVKLNFPQFTVIFVRFNLKNKAATKFIIYFENLKTSFLSKVGKINVFKSFFQMHYAVFQIYRLAFTFKNI